MMWLILVVALAGCVCEEAPSEYRGAALDGCSTAGDASCCSYSGESCSYILCQTGCGEWGLESWACL